MEIRSLQETDFDIQFKAFQSAFADYEIQLNKQELETMPHRREFAPWPVIWSIQWRVYYRIPI